MALTKTPIELSSTPSIVDGGNATAITIDSSENVMVNRTSVFTTAKMEIQSDAGDASTLALNSIDTDGSILEFYKAGTAVGSIGVAAGPVAYMVFNDTTSDNVAALKGASGAILPSTNAGADKDGTMNLGSSGARFESLYLSGGAYLGGTGAANKLDDYEEGTWTPTDDSGAGLAITVNAASYTKIGRLCYIYAYITYPANSSTASQQLSGLPFPTRVVNTYAQLTVRIVNAALSTEHITLQLQTNSSYGRLHYATTIPDNADLSGTAVLISGVYEVA